MTPPLLPANESRPARLGKGLSAIFADSDPLKPDPGARVRTLPIEQITANPNQPRKHFEQQPLEELADSIRQKGILQPLLVRPSSTQPNSYEIVAGERRWRASQLAGLHEVPVIVKDLKDKEMLELALIENIQREDLSPIEEAETFQNLIEDYGHTAEELAEALGKSRAHIANTLRLNTLPEKIKEMVKKGELTAGHARALLMAEDPLAMAKEVVAGSLSVRQTENLVKSSRGDDAHESFERAPRKGSPQARPPHAQKDADVLKLERDVSGWIGLKATITPAPDGSGSLTIDYMTLDQLEDVLARLSQAPPERMVG